MYAIFLYNSEATFSLASFSSYIYRYRYLSSPNLWVVSSTDKYKQGKTYAAHRKKVYDNFRKTGRAVNTAALVQASDAAGTQ